MAIIKKSVNTRCWRECGERRTFQYYWWECKLVQSIWRIIWRFLKKLKIEFSYDPAIPLLGIYPEKTVIWKDTCTPMFIAVLFTIARNWTQPSWPWTHEQIEKMRCIYTVGLLLSHKKEWKCHWQKQLDLEIIVLSEVSQTEKAKYHRIFICAI